MSMSKKDFIALADAMRTVAPNDNVENVSWEQVVQTLVHFCYQQNSAFKEDRWRDYLAGECGPNGGAIKKGV